MKELNEAVNMAEKLSNVKLDEPNLPYKGLEKGMLKDETFGNDR